MAAKPIPLDGDDLRRRYEFGLALAQISSEVGASVMTVRRRLLQSGVVLRPRGDGVNVFKRRHAAVADSVVTAYQTGRSEKSVAEQFGLARGTVRTMLRNASVAARGRSEANVLRMRDDSLAGRAVRNAHLSLGAGEAELAAMLAALNRPPLRQTVVGRYNVDLSIESVAVEVHARGCHPLAPSMRQRERVKYFLDRGWTVIYVWITPKHRLDRRAAEQIVALADRANGDPANGGQYWVVRGSGELLAGGDNYLDQISLVQSPRRREYSAR